jgi:hypothetical protein
MSTILEDVSFATRKGFDRPFWRIAAILIPVMMGALGTLTYISQTPVIWGFLFVLWFVVLDACLIGLMMFRHPRPPIASRLTYCVVALMGGAAGAVEESAWGGAIPIVTMLLAVLAALILEQLFAMALGVVRFLSRR